MKVKCTKCNMVEEISGENLELLSKMISMYNQAPKASDYVAILSIIKGDCEDREKHIFSFDAEFMEEIDEIRKQYEDATIMRNARNGDMLKAEDDIKKYLSEIKELEDKAKEIGVKIDKLQEEKEIKNKEIEGIDVSISEMKSKLKNLTGLSDIKMWS